MSSKLYLYLCVCPLFGVTDVTHAVRMQHCVPDVKDGRLHF